MTGLKALFLYPNTPLLNPPPVSLGIFTALLKERGVNVRIFDTTFHMQDTTSDEAKQDNLQVRPFSFDEQNLPISTNAPQDDLKDVVAEYNPDIILLSVLECTWDQGSELLDALQSSDKAVVMVGGIFASCAPEIVMAHPAVDLICIGEGEGALTDVCDHLSGGKSLETIANLWIKNREDGSIRKNPIRRVVELDTLPLPDYSAFHPARFLRPMAGTVYRTIPVETNRGCPFTCTFCNSPSTADFYRQEGGGKFFRKKSLDRIQAELRFLIKTWDAEYVYFPSDTFLVMSDEEFDRFIEIYSEFRLPFWIQSRAETITPYRAKKLKEIGCHRMSIGLEHGNEEFRRSMLKKRFKNEQLIKAAEALAEANIPLSVNNIIGFPEETRELIFDTIELNRRITTDSTNAYAFIPFHGTPLHTYCVEKGWIDPNHVFGCVTLDLPLDMPQLNRNEIKGLRKTFALYAKLPKSLWDEIKVAEGTDEAAREAMNRLRPIFQKTAWGDSQA